MERSPTCTAGLSPRVRGNPISEARAIGSRRSIPASAGEPPRPGRTLPGTSVYPRECGGTQFSQTERPQAVGLSPRVRGNRPTPRVTAPSGGSIPASAGEPLTVWSRERHDEVYPRECGGTDSGGSHVSAHDGLSPRVRGNQVDLENKHATARSIPASAGEPRLLWRLARCEKVYPRECGGTILLTP